MSAYGQHLLEAIVAGIVLGFAICYAIGRWWPQLESEKKDAHQPAGD